VKIVIGGVYYISLVKNVIGGIYYVGGLLVKIISEFKIWYHLHVEVSKTLHALENCETCLT